MKLTPELLRGSWRSWYSSDLQVVGPGWLQLVWTAVFSLVVGVMFFVLAMSLTVIGKGRWPSAPAMLHWLAANLLVALCIGFTIHLLFAIATRTVGVARIRAFSNRQRGLFFGGIPLLGTAIGWPLGASLVAGSVGGWFPFGNPQAIAGSLLFSALVCFLFYLHFDAKARQVAAEMAATEAQLKALQAQIEPHFLFNTLANVLALIEHDTPRAKAMLEAFTDYLRSSLATLRREAAPLAGELALAEAYLKLLGTRMEERLRYRIDADPALAGLPVPPLLLQPLVENAIRHGLEPKIEGGLVIVKARRDGDELVLEVHDDGLGHAATTPPGNGVALDNIRARLRGRFGSQASLELIAAQPGTRAVLRMPIEGTTA